MKPKRLTINPKQCHYDIPAFTPDYIFNCFYLLYTMKIDITQKVLDYEGKPIMKEPRAKLNKDGSVMKDEAGQVVLYPTEPMTLRDLISTAINDTTRDEILTPEDKNKIFQISVKLWTKKDMDLSVDDRAFINERAGKTLSAIGYGRVCEAMEDNKDK